MCYFQTVLYISRRKMVGNNNNNKHNMKYYIKTNYKSTCSYYQFSDRITRHLIFLFTSRRKKSPASRRSFSQTILTVHSAHCPRIYTEKFASTCLTFLKVREWRKSCKLANLLSETNALWHIISHLKRSIELFEIYDQIHIHSVELSFC